MRSAMVGAGDAGLQAAGRGERWYRTLVEHGTDAIVLFDAGGAVLYATPAVERLVGYTADELAGRVSIELIHPDDVPAIRDQLRHMREAPGEAVTAEFRVRHADGSWVWVEAVGKNLLHEPSVAAIVGSFRDVGDRRRMEEELRASRDQLEAIFRSVADGLIVQDARGRLVYANETAAHFLGFTSVEALLQTPSQAITRYFEILDEQGELFPADQLPGRRVLRGEQVSEVVLCFRARATGVEHWVGVRSTPVFDARGQGTLVVSVFHDLTAARALERARDEFLASVSHDLKTPLTAIQGFAQLVARRAARNPRGQMAWLQEPIEGIEKAAARMAGLIYEFLDVARMQMGRPLPLDRRHIDLVALAEREIAARQRITNRHRIVLDARVPHIVGAWDVARLERAVGNLIGNAVKYTPLGGQVTVAVAREDGPDGAIAVLSVHDWGIGIPSPDLPHVFERFYRGENALAAGIEGAGIGLANVRQIVAQHSGTVEFRSAESEGTTVIMRLPLGERVASGE